MLLQETAVGKRLNPVRLNSSRWAQCPGQDSNLHGVAQGMQVARFLRTPRSVRPDFEFRRSEHRIPHLGSSPHRSSTLWVIVRL